MARVCDVSPAPPAWDADWVATVFLVPGAVPAADAAADAPPGRHPHALSPADPFDVYGARFAGQKWHWYCDRCSYTSTNGADTLMFRCGACGFDLCARCASEHCGGGGARLTAAAPAATLVPLLRNGDVRGGGYLVVHAVRAVAPAPSPLALRLGDVAFNAWSRRPAAGGAAGFRREPWQDVMLDPSNAEMFLNSIAVEEETIVREREGGG